MLASFLDAVVSLSNISIVARKENVFKSYLARTAHDRILLYTFFLTQWDGVYIAVLIRTRNQIA